MRCSILAAVMVLAMPCVVRSAEPYGDDQIEVSVGGPFTIASATPPPPLAYPTLGQLGPKSLFLKLWNGEDDSLTKAELTVMTTRTDDGGKTWEKPNWVPASAAGSHSWIQRKDGTCLWLGFFTRPVDSRDYQTLICSVGRSSDGKAPYRWSEGRVNFPRPVQAWTKGNAYMVVARSIVELADGSLLATMYGYFEGDGKPVNFQGKGKYRTVVVRSTDNGATWDYYATVAFDPETPGEGFDEPVIARTADGDLLCVMRRGYQKGYQPSTLGGYLALASSRSKDDGRTWSAPVVLPNYATCVFPDLTLMSNGLLALSFGRPEGNHLMFSVDGKGERWTSRTTVYHEVDPKGEGSTCSYTAIREVAPGRLLYVYTYLENLITPGAPSYVRGVFVDVTRKPTP